MATAPTLTAALRAEYQALFDTCQVRPQHLAAVDRLARRITAGMARYAEAAQPLGMPWHVVGVLHAMEASLDFGTHLHNGDPLTARTVQVPRGRPLAGEPPFTWEASAADALRLQRLDRWSDWSLPGTLYVWERFNGWGYRLHHPEVKSPYLWSFTNHHARGKYVADGTWSATAVSRQVGAAALLRRLAELGVLAGAAAPAPAPVAAAAAPVPPRQPVRLRYAPTRASEHGAGLQRYLNTLPGIFLREDGRLGPRTSDACHAVFGWHLQGDPRA